MVGDLKGTGCTTWQWLEVDSNLVLKALSWLKLQFLHTFRFFLASCSWTRYACNLTAKPSGYFCSVGDGVQTIGRRISTFLWLQQWYKHVQAFLAQFTENNCVALQAGVKQLPRADCLATTSVLLSAFKLWQVGKPSQPSVDHGTRQLSCPRKPRVKLALHWSGEAIRQTHLRRESHAMCIGRGWVEKSFCQGQGTSTWIGLLR